MTGACRHCVGLCISAALSNATRFLQYQSVEVQQFAAARVAAGCGCEQVLLKAWSVSAACMLMHGILPGHL